MEELYVKYMVQDEVCTRSKPTCSVGEETPSSPGGQKGGFRRSQECAVKTTSELKIKNQKNETGPKSSLRCTVVFL